MISEVDIRDWREAVKEGYTDFVTQKAGEQAFGSEAFEAGANWAFEFFWEKLNGKQ